MADRDPLYPCWLKIHRAWEHIDTLNGLLRAFYERNSPVITTTVDSQRRKSTFRLEMPGDAPLLIGIEAGEMLYNLRSALDYLACALVRAGGAPISDRTAFPLFLKPNDGRLTPMINGMEESAKTLIRKVQPYNASHPADEMPLGALSVLSNLDKHAFIAVAGQASQLNFSPGPGRVIRHLNHGLEIDVPLEQAAHFKPEMTFTVVFGREDDAGNGYLPAIFVNMHDFIRYELFPAFTCYFPSTTWFREPWPPDYEPYGV